MKLVRVVTHHKRKEKAAELFAECKVVAVGWAELGNLKGKSKSEIKQLLKDRIGSSDDECKVATSSILVFREKVGIGDIIFAYKGNNKVALVGEVRGDYEFNNKNKVGNPNGEINYPNQREVNWWEKPRNFDRDHLKCLSDNLPGWIALPGTILIKEFEGKKDEVKGKLQEIPSKEFPDEALKIRNEKEIKNYLEKHLDKIDPSLEIQAREHSTSHGVMDFLAKDKNNVPVVIEVKVQADESAVAQTLKYFRALRKEERISKIRGIIVAQEFTPECSDLINQLRDHGFDIQCFQCEKKFNFTKRRI